MRTVHELCRDCGRLGTATGAARCPRCGSPRLVRHAELTGLAIAHLDCDAFYATVEKRDDPSLADRPVIVGGGRRGVVAAACYVARRYGVRSAMPMFKALAACPDAVVLRPNMEKYAAVGREVRERMRALTPLVEAVSIDEAYLDLSGTQSLLGGPPAASLAALARRIEAEVGITVSIGLSYNKFLAKIASERDKPRGFAVIGRSDVAAFLPQQPVGIINGVGRALEARLARDGITRIGHLLGNDEPTLVRRYGAMGRRLFHFARGEDDRRVEPDRPTRSISTETTFEHDIAELEPLATTLRALAERVADRLVAKELSGRTVTLKLRRSDFRIVTRSHTLDDPTALADVIYRTALGLLRPLAEGPAWRLIGVGVSDLMPGAAADPPDLFDPGRERSRRIEASVRAIRGRLVGESAIVDGLSSAAEATPRGDAAGTRTKNPRS